jgi:hypothetical protein
MFAIGEKWRTREDTERIFAVPQWRGSTRRFPSGNLPQVTLPCGNGRKVETIFNSFSNQSSLMAMIDSPENVSKNEIFSRAI